MTFGLAATHHSSMNDYVELQLITPRLILRDFREDDWPALHAFRSDPLVARYMDWEPETPEQTRAWVLATIPHNRAQPRLPYNLTIVRRSDDRIIGWIGIGVPSRRGDYEREYDFGYALTRAYWGQGYMAEALRALLQFAFDGLRAQRVFGECDVRNLASARVMEKVGMRREAQFRHRYAAGGDVEENFRYAIHDHEWRAQTTGP